MVWTEWPADYKPRVLSIKNTLEFCSKIWALPWGRIVFGWSSVIIPRGEKPEQIGKTFEWWVPVWKAWSVLPNTSDISPRGDRIKMESGLRGGMAVSGQTSLWCFPRSASLSWDTFLISCVWLKEVHVTKEEQIQPTAVLWFAKKSFKNWLWNSFHGGIGGTVAAGSGPGCSSYFCYLADPEGISILLLPLIVFLTLQGPAQGFFDLFFSKLIALITYYCNFV